MVDGIPTATGNGHCATDRAKGCPACWEHRFAPSLRSAMTNAQWTQAGKRLFGGALFLGFVSITAAVVAASLVQMLAMRLRKANAAAAEKNLNGPGPSRRRGECYTPSSWRGERWRRRGSAGSGSEG